MRFSSHSFSVALLNHLTFCGFIHYACVCLVIVLFRNYSTWPLNQENDDGWWNRWIVFSTSIFWGGISKMILERDDDDDLRMDCSMNPNSKWQMNWSSDHVEVHKIASLSRYSQITQQEIKSNPFLSNHRLSTFSLIRSKVRFETISTRFPSSIALSNTSPSSVQLPFSPSQIYSNGRLICIIHQMQPHPSPLSSKQFQKQHLQKWQPIKS